ncbi:MAG: hypothetical protein Kow0032_05590 [Methyloligellaceae bacterium]
MEAALFLFVLLGFATSLISAILGFGTALVLLSLGAFLLPIQECIALATVSFAVATLTKSLLFRAAIDWRMAGVMALVSLPFAWAGATLVPQAPAELLRKLLGGMILAYLVVASLPGRPGWRVGWGGLVAGSAAYGFISGLLGSGNAVKAVLFREMAFSKEAFVGAMAATSVLSNLAKLAAYAQADLLTRAHLVPAAALAVSTVVAVIAGRFVLLRMGEEHFDAGLRVLLAVAGIGLLL